MTDERHSPGEAARMAHDAHQKIVEQAAELREILQELGLWDAAQPFMDRARTRALKFCRRTSYPLVDTAREAAAGFTGLLFFERVRILLAVQDGDDPTEREEVFREQVENFRSFTSGQARPTHRRWKKLVDATLEDLERTALSTGDGS